MELRYDIAEDLLAIKAVQVNPNDYYTWASGIKSPIYCDNRLAMSYPTVRNSIVSAFVQLIGRMEQQPDLIAGCATAGIPYASWIAKRLNLPMVYVRQKPKTHGKRNQIEGMFRPGQCIVVIEDLISTGNSSIETASALKQNGANVLGVLAIFTYGLEVAQEQFKKANLKCWTITDYDDVLKLSVEKGLIDDRQFQQLCKWRNQLSLV